MKKAIKRVKKMQFNKELRTRSMVIRFHILWVIFYVAVFVVVGIFAYKLYDEHKEDSLPAGSITLSTNKTKYQVGEVVKFKVTNHFPTTIYVANTCPSEPLDVYIWQNKKWQQISAIARNPDSKCYGQPRRIAVAPNSSLSYSYKEWPDLFAKPGVYRIIMKVDHYEGVPFRDFKVLKKRKVINQTDSSSVTSTQLQSLPAPTQNTDNDDAYEDNAKKEPEVEVENEVDDD